MPIVTTGEVTITDVNDSASLVLTQYAAVIPANADGSAGVYTTATTTAGVRMGVLDASASWTFSATPSSGVTGTFSNRIYTVTNMTNSTGYVDITATAIGASPLTARFNLSKGLKGTGGTNGTNGERGTKQVAAATTGTAWSNTEATAAIAAAGWGTPITGDVVTLYNTAAGFSQTRVRASGGSWDVLAAFFGGDVLVDGTITSQKVKTGSITASKIKISDASNIYPDFDMDDTSFYSSDGSVYSFGAANSSVAGVLELRLEDDGEAFSGWFPVDPKSFIRASATTRNGTATAGLTGTVHIELGNYSSGTVAATRRVQCVTRVNSASNLRGEVDINDLANTENRARFVLVRSGGVSGGYVTMSGLRVRHRATAELIVDGEIKANHLTTSSAVITGTAQIGSAVISTANIANLAVDTAQIATAAITNAKIDALAVTSAKIADLTVGTLKITDNAVTNGVSASAGTNTGSTNAISSRNVTISCVAGTKVAIWLKSKVYWSTFDRTMEVRVYWNGTQIFLNQFTTPAGPGGSSYGEAVLDEMTTQTAIGGTNTLRFESEAIGTSPPSWTRVFGPAIMIELKK